MKELNDENIYEFVRYQEIKRKLVELRFSNDREAAHIEADELLCEMLKMLGFEDIVLEFDQIPKWYA